MSVFDKVRVKTGLARSNKFNLNCHHVTTQDFFKIRPVYYRELIPGQSARILHSNFCRLMPLDKPMIGGAKFVNRGFFVPYRVVFPYFNDFISDTTSIDGTSVVKITQSPWVYNQDLAQYLINQSECMSQVAQGNAYDVYDVTSTKYYKFTNIGRRVMTVLNGLGISVDFNQISSTDKGLPISILNILCYCKVYFDWYANPAYESMRTVLESYLYEFRLGGQLTSAQLVTLWAMLRDCSQSLYDNDYFTSAFDRPVSPNDGSFSNVNISDVTNDASASGYKSKVSVASSSGTYQPSTPTVSGTNSSTPWQVNHLSQFIADSLKSLTEYIKRYQLVGSRTLDRYMANFGIQLDSDKLKRSIYLGKNESVIEVSDVMSSANTDTVDPNTQQTVNTPVGDYSGKGVSMQRNGEFSYKSDEFGCIIIMSTIIPKIGYVQGVNRMNLHIDRFDFFTPDFDALGPQAIARGELFNDGCTFNQQNTIPQTNNKDGIFGYTPRYSEYAVSNDWLSGDFRLHSKNSELQTWHLFRMFNPDSQAKWGMIEHHSSNFLEADHSQYDRIFNYNGDDYDHFIVVHRFDVESNMAKKPLFDQFDWEDGRTILTNLNGTRLN